MRHISPVWRVSKEGLKEIIVSSQTITQVLNKLGLQSKGSNHLTLKRRLAMEGIDYVSLLRRSREYVNGFLHKQSAQVRIPLDKCLVKGYMGSRGHVKRKLLEAGLVGTCCQICKQGSIWHGKPLVLILDHINGDSTDYRIKNLRLVCPNCNSQLSTFGSRNFKIVAE